MTERERVFLLARIFDLLKYALRYAFYAWVVWNAYLAVKELAGKSTDASFFFQYIFSRDNDYGLPWAVALGCAMWAIFERRFRKQKTAELTARIQELEKRIDPKRTTSGLLASGDTNPRDEIV